MLRDTHPVDRSDARLLIGAGWAVAIAGVVVSFCLFLLVAQSQGLGVGDLLLVIVVAAVASTVMWLRGLSALLKARHHGQSWTAVDTTFLIMGIIGALVGLLICVRILFGLF